MTFLILYMMSDYNIWEVAHIEQEVTYTLQILPNWWRLDTQTSHFKQILP